MKGNILDCGFKNGGVINGNDRKRYKFEYREWKSKENPRIGQSVDFETDGHDNALSIYVERKNAPVDNGDNFLIIAWLYYLDVMKNKYAQFDGRANLREYWYFSLMNLIISVGLILISAGTLGLIYTLATLIPLIALSTRRLHDIGKSGWLQLIVFIPIIGIIVLMIFSLKSSQPHSNQYGNEE